MFGIFKNILILENITTLPLNRLYIIVWFHKVNILKGNLRTRMHQSSLGIEFILKN